MATAFGKNNTWGYVSGDVNSIVSLLKATLDSGKSVTIGTNTSQPAGSVYGRQPCVFGPQHQQ